MHSPFLVYLYELSSSAENTFPLPNVPKIKNKKEFCKLWNNSWSKPFSLTSKHLVLLSVVWSALLYAWQINGRHAECTHTQTNLSWDAHCRCVTLRLIRSMWGKRGLVATRSRGKHRKESDLVLQLFHLLSCISSPQSSELESSAFHPSPPALHRESCFNVGLVQAVKLVPTLPWAPKAPTSSRVSSLCRPGSLGLQGENEKDFFFLIRASQRIKDERIQVKEKKRVMQWWVAQMLPKPAKLQREWKWGNKEQTIGNQKTERSHMTGAGKAEADESDWDTKTVDQGENEQRDSLAGASG